jgi:hypothetical protein
MSILLSDEEINALHGEDYFLYVLYVHAIRRYMDYATGIVGIKRRISYQSLREELYVEPRRGVDRAKTGSPSKPKLQRALQTLQDRGILEQIKNKDYLIFRCVFAKQDKSVQNQADTKSIQKLDTQADTHTLDKNLELTGLSAPTTRKADTHADTPVLAQADTPPLSGKDKDKSIEAYVHSRFNDFWKIYPRKENKKKAYSIWERMRLDAKADSIINDVILRIEKHEPWKDKQYIPHATTYLNGERWEDEIREGQDDKYQQTTKQNSVSVALDNILRSSSKKVH